MLDSRGYFLLTIVFVIKPIISVNSRDRKIKVYFMVKSTTLFKQNYLKNVSS